MNDKILKQKKTTTIGYLCVCLLGILMINITSGLVVKTMLYSTSLSFGMFLFFWIFLTIGFFYGLLVSSFYLDYLLNVKHNEVKAIRSLNNFYTLIFSTKKIVKIEKVKKETVSNIKTFSKSNLVIQDRAAIQYKYKHRYDNLDTLTFYPSKNINVSQVVKEHLANLQDLEEKANTCSFIYKNENIELKVYNLIPETHLEHLNKGVLVPDNEWLLMSKFSQIFRLCRNYSESEQDEKTIKQLDDDLKDFNFVLSNTKNTKLEYSKLKSALISYEINYGFEKIYERHDNNVVSYYNPYFLKDFNYMMNDYILHNNSHKKAYEFIMNFSKQLQEDQDFKNIYEIIYSLTDRWESTICGLTFENVIDIHNSTNNEFKINIQTFNRNYEQARGYHKYTELDDFLKVLPTSTEDKIEARKLLILEIKRSLIWNENK